jgi:hypothetical protein
MTDTPSNSSQTSCSITSSPRKDQQSDEAEGSASPTRPLVAFLRIFHPRRKVEQPGSKYELPLFQHRRQESDAGVLVSREIKSEVSP